MITVNEGALAEQFVGQQLLCAAPAFENPQLLYWARETRNANAEVAFVMSRNQEMEKSGAMAAVGGPQPKGRLPPPRHQNAFAPPPNKESYCNLTRKYCCVPVRVTNYTGS